MAVTKQQKSEILDALTENFKKAKSVVFSQYQGTNVKNMRELRKRLLHEKAVFKVARKTLISLAAKKTGFDQIPGEFLEGPIGLAFGMGNEIAPAKVLHEFGKSAETVKIVGAIFEGKFINAAEATALAKLPDRKSLLAQLVGTMKAPISGFHSVLYGVMRNFVFALSEVAKQRAQRA